MQPVNELVKAAMREAIRLSGGRAASLAEALQQEGLRPHYKTVSGWARGDAKPSAEALMAAARVTEMSLDRFVFGEAAGLQDQLQSVQVQVRSLSERVRQLEDERPDDA